MAPAVGVALQNRTRLSEGRTRRLRGEENGERFTAEPLGLENTLRGSSFEVFRGLIQQIAPPEFHDAVEYNGVGHGNQRASGDARPAFPNS